MCLLEDVMFQLGFGYSGVAGEPSENDIRVKGG